MFGVPKKRLFSIIVKLYILLVVVTISIHLLGIKTSLRLVACTHEYDHDELNNRLSQKLKCILLKIRTINSNSNFDNVFFFSK